MMISNWSWKTFFKNYVIILAVLTLVKSFNFSPTEPDLLSVITDSQPRIDVSHRITENDAILDITLRDFTLTMDRVGEQAKQGEGHIHLYVDGEKVGKIFHPRYVIKNLSPGEHTIRLELAHNNHREYGIGQEFKMKLEK